jgi:uncharacterized membrane protein YvbJ
MTQANKHITELMDRFFDGSTSNEEERELYTFFSGEDIPAHLLPYKSLFAYFESGIEAELNQETAKKVTLRIRKKKVLWWSSVAASLLILLSLQLFYVSNKQEAYPYEGSYIIRNGVKITDPKIVKPEIEKTLQMAMLQQVEYEQMIQEMNNLRDPYLQIMKEIEKQKDDLLKQFKDETFRDEVKKILNKQL